MYKTMLSENPELNNIFNHANQVNNSQPQALAGSLYAYASHIDDLGALSPAVEKICQKHASLYIRPEQYETVATYLLKAMGDVLGAALTPEVLEAWGVAYWQLANIMINKEAGMMKERPGWTDWRDFRIARKVPESDEITSFYLEPVDGQKLPPFLPGQYISVMTNVPKLKYLQSRQYSLSDAPESSYYRVSVKREDGLNYKAAGAEAHPGYISNVLHAERKVGDVVSVSHPAGEFFLDPWKEINVPVVLISAGVGLTPMTSILNTLIKRRSQQRISFVHAARSTSVRAFKDHIRDIVARNANVNSAVFIKTPDTDQDVKGVDYHHIGRMNLDALDKVKDLFLDSKDTIYFVCGPDTFMKDIAYRLADLGVEESRVRLELFGTGAIPTA